ncbi:MAG TPA: ABC transporter ATP-binding protein [Candidatus Angelobacter sp.]|nr:ABC transporter ATP-binding protein [Candidatus Angelobacter sp.]
MPVLHVKDLHTTFFTDDGQVPAVEGVSFHINEGEVLGIVGESGCGKSVTSLSVMGLISEPGKIVSGEIQFKGQDLTKLPEHEMRKLRGNEIAMIFQEPMTSLNPVYKIGNQLIEPLEIHQKLSKKAARVRAIELLKLVGLPRPNELLNEYPHQLSGGMRQRVMIAIAMACNPKVLIADEPTTALDVTIQKQILNLMKSLNRETGTAIMLITHDLGVVAQMCQRVVVMYGGKVVEEGDVRTIFRHPKHPYTVGLIKSVPDLRETKNRLYSIPGNVPKPGSVKKGCYFAERCDHAMEICHTDTPHLNLISDQHQVRCFLYEEEKGGI